MDNRDIGEIGEQQVIYFLKDKGYDIIQKNWRFKKLEIDIIAKKDDLMVVVEVKTRSYTHLVDPIESITKKKQTNIINAADEYMLQESVDDEVRFDVALVIEDRQGNFKIKYIENAFNTLSIV